MSVATTTVYLYIGFDHARRTREGLWPLSFCGHIEIVDWLESMAEHLDSLYDQEFACLNLSCVFDYDITEELGAWLYQNLDVDLDGFSDEARRLVAEVQKEDAERLEAFRALGPDA